MSVHGANGRPPLATFAAPRGGPPTIAPRLYLADDNDGLRASLCDLVADAGVEVVGQAGDSAEAIRAVPPAAASLPLVVLMDVRMPGPINGIEATRLLMGCCQRIAVIIFTAFPGGGIEQAARRAGAVELLAKGCPPEVIIAAVTRAWSRMVPDAS